MSYQQIEPAAAAAARRCIADGNLVVDTDQHTAWHQMIADRLLEIERLQREVIVARKAAEIDRKLASAVVAHRFGDIEREDETYAALNTATEEWLNANA